MASAAPSEPVVPAAAGPLDERGTVLHDNVRSASWSTRGVTKVVGAVEVGHGELEGFVAVGDAFTATDLSIRGSLDVGGAVAVAHELSLHGSLRAGKGLTAGTAALSGTVHVVGGAEVSGALIARGTFFASSVTAREARLAGTVRIAQSLGGAAVELELAEGSALGTVTGRTVRAKGPDGGVLDRLLGRYRHARIERIEADTVDLEKVEVGYVKAREVRLGRDSHVAQLDATNLAAHPSARVGPESRSAPPPGLRR